MVRGIAEGVGEGGGRGQKGREEMKKGILIIALLMIFCGSARAFDDWTKEDTIWQASIIALEIVDWGQTRYIARNPDDWYEFNPLLGRHPSTDQVDAYFAGGILIKAAIAYVLPTKYNLWGYEINPRRIWQLANIAGSGACVAWNVSAGIRVEF